MKKKTIQRYKKSYSNVLPTLCSTCPAINGIVGNANTVECTSKLLQHLQGLLFQINLERFIKLAHWLS